MRAVAIRAVVLWDQVYTILTAKKHDFAVDDYLLRSIQSNAKRLEESLVSAIGSGLVHEIMSTREKALVLFTTFLQSLNFITTTLPSDELLEACIKDHFTLGMIRLLDRCILYSPKLFPNDLDKKISEDVVPHADMAWGYLDEQQS
jgi:hypothetical protein